MAVVDSTTKMNETTNVPTVTKSEKKQANKDLQKTRLCIYNLEGKCGYGSNCTFAHSALEVKHAPDLSKTQLCTKFAEGKCSNKNCTYAHGEAELVDPPNFKKKMCKWFSKGNCRNGIGCGFAHNVIELRAEAPPGLADVGGTVPGWKTKKIAAPPGLSKMEDCDASTDVPSSKSHVEYDSSMIGGSTIPEEHLFRLAAGRGSAPLQNQVVAMTAAIGGLQAKLAQLEDMMLQSQVTAMQQQIAQLSEQCWSLEAGLGGPPTATPLRSRLSAKATPFEPKEPIESDASTSVGSEVTC